MNSTSFTSVDPIMINNTNNSNDKNIDSSSTAHLTLNAAIGSGASGRPTRSTICSNSNSDSDVEASPSVAVLTSTGNSSHHLHHSIPRPSRLLSGGFSFSNRLHLTTKHQRTLWSRATHFEKILMLALVILFTVSLVLLISLSTVILSQKNQLKEFLSPQNASTKRTSLEPEHMGIEFNGITSIVTSANQTIKYCLTPDCVKVAASVIEAIDLSVDPCEDFYVSSRAFMNVCRRCQKYQLSGRQFKRRH